WIANHTTEHRLLFLCWIVRDIQPHILSIHSVACMVKHNVYHQLNATIMRFVDELLEGIQISKMLIELREILCPVAMVAILILPRLTMTYIPVHIVNDWRNPYRINP